jgi:hypothetical protein
MPKFTIPSSIPLKIVYILLTILGLFQLALIFGMPWGQAAWGGQHSVLPTAYRWGSASSIGLYIFFAWVLRRREQHWRYAFPRVVSWIIVGFFALGVIANVASSSRYEQLIWAPVAAVLTICSFLIARPAPNIYGPYSYFPNDDYTP